jgi:hypothetical protein
MKIYLIRSDDLPRSKMISVPVMESPGQDSMPGLVVVHPQDAKRVTYSLTEQGYEVETIQTYYIEHEKKDEYEPAT